MKILYVITGLAQGGAEHVVCDLADSMVNKGHEVKIAYLTGDVITLPESKSIELIKINLNKAKDLPSAYLRLAKLIKSYNPDIVHSHMVHANILTRLIKVLVPVNKLISTAHSNNEGGSLRMFMYRVTHNLADISTNVSKNAVNAFEIKHAIPKDGMETIYNGIDLNRYKFIESAKNKLYQELNIDSNYRLILAVGRFNVHKDYLNLLQAIKILSKEINFPFKLIVAGDGEQRKEIENYIEKENLDKTIVLLGRRNDIAHLMSAADIFVLSSKYEGFGLVVAEAMACECLVVATDCGGVAEVLDNSEFLVPASDPIALKNKLKYALELENEEAKKVTDKNLNHVIKNFSLENIAKKWISLYHE